MKFKHLLLILGALFPNKFLFGHGSTLQSLPDGPPSEGVAYNDLPSLATQRIPSYSQAHPASGPSAVPLQACESEAPTNPMESKYPLGTLPIELWVEILSFLNIQELNAFSQSSRFANELVVDLHTEIAKKRESKLSLLIRSEFLKEISEKAAAGQSQERPEELFATRYETVNFKLKNCPLDFDICLIAPRIKNLRRLYINSSLALSHEGLSCFLDEVTHLEFLDIANAYEMKDEDLGLLAEKARHLKELYVRLDGVTDQGLEKLVKGLQDLECLHLRYPIRANKTLTVAGIKALATHLKKLKELSLEDHEYLIDEGLRILAQEAGQIRSLNLSWCTQIGPEGVVDLVKGLTNLQSLNLNFCQNMNDNVLVALGQSPIKLKSLSLRLSKIVTGKGLMALSKNAGSLECLNLGSCWAISEEGFIVLAKNAVRLRELNVSFCSELGDESLFALADHAKNIRYLDLTGCKKITNKGVVKLRENAIHLRHLNLSNCEQLKAKN